MKSVLLALSLLLAVSAANAKDLPATDAAVIKAAGIPIYEQAVFLDGSRRRAIASPATSRRPP